MFKDSNYLMMMVYTKYSGRPIDTLPALIKVDNTRDSENFRVDSVLRYNYAFGNYTLELFMNNLYLAREHLILYIPKYNFNQKGYRYDDEKDILTINTIDTRILVKPLNAEDDASAMLLYDTCSEELINEFR